MGCKCSEGDGKLDAVDRVSRVLPNAKENDARPEINWKRDRSSPRAREVFRRDKRD
jgi:hypothetical protein